MTSLVVSASLEGPQATFALRPRSGKPQVTNGPYAEAKEMVGGFFIIEGGGPGRRGAGGFAASGGDAGGERRLGD